jgi:hypothetical protein
LIKEREDIIMALTPEQIEWLHDNGKMPDWAYYQQNGKTAQQNYADATRRARERIMKLYEEQQAEAKRKEEEKKLEADIEKQVEKAIEKALDKLLKDFK